MGRNLALVLIAVGVAITVLGSTYVYSMEQQCWCGYVRTFSTILMGIATILIGLSELMKARR